MSLYAHEYAFGHEYSFGHLFSSFHFLISLLANMIDIKQINHSINDLIINKSVGLSINQVVNQSFGQFSAEAFSSARRYRWWQRLFLCRQRSRSEWRGRLPSLDISRHRIIICSSSSSSFLNSSSSNGSIHGSNRRQSHHRSVDIADVTKCVLVQCHLLQVDPSIISSSFVQISSLAIICSFARSIVQLLLT